MFKWFVLSLCFRSLFACKNPSAVVTYDGSTEVVQHKLKLSDRCFAVKFVSNEPDNVLWSFSINVHLSQTFGPKPQNFGAHRLTFFTLKNKTRLDDGRCSQSWYISELYNKLYPGANNRSQDFTYYHESPLDKTYEFGLSCWNPKNLSDQFLCEEFKTSPDMDIEMTVTFSKTVIDPCSIGDNSCEACAKKVGFGNQDCVRGRGENGGHEGCYTVGHYSDNPSKFHYTEFPWQRCGAQYRWFNFTWNGKEAGDGKEGADAFGSHTTSRTPFEDLKHGTTQEKTMKAELMTHAKLRDLRRIRQNWVQGAPEDTFIYSSPAKIFACDHYGGSSQSVMRRAIDQYLPDGVSVEGDVYKMRYGSMNPKWPVSLYADVLLNEALGRNLYSGLVNVYKDYYQHAGLCIKEDDRLSIVLFNVTGTPSSPVTCKGGTVQLGGTYNRDDGKTCTCEQGGVNCGYMPSWSDMQARLANEFDPDADPDLPIPGPPIPSSPSPNGNNPAPGSPTSSETSSAPRLMCSFTLNGFTIAVLLSLQGFIFFV